MNGRLYIFPTNLEWQVSKAQVFSHKKRPLDATKLCLWSPAWMNDKQEASAVAGGLSAESRLQQVFHSWKLAPVRIFQLKTTAATHISQLKAGSCAYLLTESWLPACLAANSRQRRVSLSWKPPPMLKVGSDAYLLAQIAGSHGYLWKDSRI
jgi:hypothetical protein